MGLARFVRGFLGIFDKLYNSFVLHFKKIECGRNVKINGRLHIAGHGKIRIADNVRINSSFDSNPTAGGLHTQFNCFDNSVIDISENVGMSQVSITAMKSVVIEKNVFIGACVKIWDTDFHSLDYSDRINGDINPKSAPVLIKEGAFIGACSIILKGVTIVKHSVIGAGSVVTKDVPDYEIWAGNPAVFIRKIEEK